MPPAEKQSKWIPGRYPAPGTSSIGDAIRQRRGERGITALDAALLHVPAAAEGWNTLLGAVRTKGMLSGDIRELIVSVYRSLIMNCHVRLLVLDFTCSCFEWCCV